MLDAISSAQCNICINRTIPCNKKWMIMILLLTNEYSFNTLNTFGIYEIEWFWYSKYLKGMAYTFGWTKS